MSFRITLSMPCYGRPKRTIRAIECIAKQNINDWEALVTGDGCPIMEDFIRSGEFLDLISECQSRGNSLVIKNNEDNYGHCGYHVTNQHINSAKGRWFAFFANDDIILENHLDHYLSEAEGTDLDFVYYNSFVNPLNRLRVSNLSFGGVGHSELIIRTNFLKSMEKHDPKYGHDWKLIQDMIDSTDKYKKAESVIPTYYVMSLPNNQETNIN